jgi:MFS family permease
MHPLLKELIDITDVQKKVDGKSERVIRAKQRALKDSINEGASSSFAAGVSTSYITRFALELKSTPFQIGVLSSLAGIIYPISQLIGSKLMAKHSRKKIVIKFVIFQALMWIPLAILSILFWKEFFQQYLPYVLIGCYTLMVAFGGVAYPAVFSWLGDLVPPKDRGKFFSVRNRAMELVGLAAVLMAAFFLDAFETKGLVFIGFAVLFMSALTFRMISYYFFKKQYSPKFKVNKSSYFSIWNFLHTFDNYGKFSVYLMFFNLAIMIASPFFAVYLVNELKVTGYVMFTVIMMSSSVFYLLFTPLAGKFSDKYGNIKLFYISNIFFAITPILWIFTKTPLSIILIPQLSAGIANAAYVISTTNFTYESVSPQRRGICVAYTNLLTGVGVFVGSLVGGFLLKYLSISGLNIFFFVFILAAISRFVVGVVFLPYLKEEKKVQRIPHVHVSLMHPFKTLHTEVGWFKSIFK